MRGSVIVGLLLAVVIGMTGCGGGGGGGGDVGTSYKGSTIQATVSASNAKAVSVDAVQGAQNVSGVGVLGKSVAGIPKTSPQMLSIVNILESSVILISPKSSVAKTVAETVQQTNYGYSGSFSFTINGNNSTGSFSGSLTFNNYQEYSGSPILSGNASFSGVANTSTSEITSIHMSFDNLQGVLGAQSFTLNGSIAISSTGNTKTLNISIVNLDNINNKTYWIKDFNIVLTGNIMTISGSYYDHVHGYVVISTVNPLTVSTYSGEPTSGQLLFTGSNGTKARLIYATSGYLLEVDASGNNIYVVVP